MRIAFDVKGTLDGPKGKFVLALLREMQKLGHEVVVWSNAIGFASNFVDMNGLQCDFMSKKMKSDLYSESEMFDVAIEDDTGQTWLAAKRFIWVHEFPDAMGGVLKLAQELHNSQK